jgi:hypothetical protein
MHPHIRANYQNAYKQKFARQRGERPAAWLARINAAIADINATMPLHDSASEYVERLYIELDCARDAFTLAMRAVAPL